jgi:hypothetical protein
MRSAAELNTFRYSLGGLRVALVLDRLRAAVRVSKYGGEAATNPFLLLGNQPINYDSGVTLKDAEVGKITPGSWFFDAACSCIGYRLRDDLRFLGPSPEPLMVFRLSPPGVLAARATYVWRGEVID